MTMVVVFIEMSLAELLSLVKLLVLLIFLGLRDLTGLYFFLLIASMAVLAPYVTLMLVC
jgi:hypothetical protein